MNTSQDNKIAALEATLKAISAKYPNLNEGTNRLEFYAKRCGVLPEQNKVK
jgi:hypothetical protein